MDSVNKTNWEIFSENTEEKEVLKLFCLGNLIDLVCLFWEQFLVIFTQNIACNKTKNLISFIKKLHNDMDQF